MKSEEEYAIEVQDVYKTFDVYLDKANSININDPQKKQDITKLASIASILILISGIIFLIIAIKDENIDLEHAFN